MESSFSRIDKIINMPEGTPINTPASKVFRPLQWHIYNVFLVFNDLFMTAVAFMVAYHIRFTMELDIFFRTNVNPDPPFYQGLGTVLLFFWFAVFMFYGLYNRGNLLGGTNEYALVFRATGTSMLVLLMASYFSEVINLARGWLLLAWLFAFSFVIIGRFFLRRLVYLLRQFGYFLSPTLIVGANEEGQMLADQLVHWRKSGLHVMGFVSEREQNSKTPSTIQRKGLRVLGSLNQLDDLIAEYHVEELIIATSSLSRKNVVALFERFGMVKNLNLRLSSGLFETITTGLQVSEIAAVPLVRVNQLRLKDSERTIKCVLDYAISIPLLVFAVPFFALVALAVKIDSPGPAFHRRRVMGINGTQFDAFKFRTMHINGDQILAQHPELQKALAEDHKLKNDPRITRVGRILRKTSLDETPQLMNILVRQMSLVGPRIIAPSEMEKFGKWSTNLLTVHPGLSGLWQVSGRSDLTYEDRVKLDMYYIRNWSIWMDLRIMFQTISVIIRGQGAY